MATARTRYVVWTLPGPGQPGQLDQWQCRSDRLPRSRAYAYARELAAAGGHFVAVRPAGVATPVLVQPWCEHPTSDAAVCGRGDLVDDGPRGLRRCPDHQPPPPAALAIPAAPVVVDPDAGAWIREHVLRPRYRTDDQYHRVMVALCRCQYGLCGACARDEHHRCLQRTGPDRPSPETYLVTWQGMVMASVWTTGVPCRYRCPCPTCHQLATIATAPVYEITAAAAADFEQLTLI